MNAIVRAESAHEIMGTVLIKGDLSKLTPEERNSYYFRLCESVGLNPLTQPLQYINLSGKLTLYAKKDCTDQLRSIHDISVTDLTKETIEGVHIVTAKVQNAKGRTDADIGAVNVANLKGEAFANAIMKAATKAKRRATLSICGLGLLDETEIEDIPASQKAPAQRSRVPSPSDAKTEAKAAPEAPHLIGGGKDAANWSELYLEAVLSSDSPAVVFQWVSANKNPLDKIAKMAPDILDQVQASVEKHLAFLRKTAPKEDPISSGVPKSNAMPNHDENPAAWMVWVLDQIAKTAVGDAMDALFESVDPFWMDLNADEKDALNGARRAREAEMEP
jgi:hypothetical protein